MNVKYTVLTLQAMTVIPIAVLTLILSAVLYLMVEQPVATLKRLILRRRKLIDSGKTQISN
jgi:peptidoglycan/LPS O-acetylase OafA/YrhL